jgi:hypothetical protein
MTPFPVPRLPTSPPAPRRLLLALLSAVLVTACDSSVDVPAPPVVASIRVEPVDSLTVGSSRAIKYTLLDAKGVAVTPADSVSVSSASPTIARVDRGAAGYTVTGVKVGSTEIVVQNGGKEGRAALKVIADSALVVARVQVEPADSLTVGSSRAIKYTLFNSKGVAVPGDSVSVSSASPTIARVDKGAAGYTVTGLKVGSTELVVQSGGKEGRAPVKVIADSALVVARIQVEPADSLTVGSSRTVRYTLFNSRGVAVPGDSVSVSSASPTIARVDKGAAGYTITGVKVGSTELIVQSGGKEGRATVMVRSGSAALAQGERLDAATRRRSGGAPE